MEAIGDSLIGRLIIMATVNVTPLTVPQIVDGILRNIAAEIESSELALENKWEATLCDDGESGGPYLHVGTRHGEGGHRCLGLFREEDSMEELSSYHWTFWDEAYTVDAQSDLDATATPADVLGFFHENVRLEGVKQIKFNG